jgi:hypothetical protein
MSDLIAPLLAALAFVLGGHIVGRFHAYRQVYIFHRVDPKFREAPDLQYELYLLELGIVLWATGVCFVVGSLISLHWQRGWLLSPLWSLLIGPSHIALYLRIRPERRLSWLGIGLLVVVPGVTGFFSATGSG